MSVEMPWTIGALFVALFCSAFLWFMLCLIAYIDGEHDANRDEWSDDHHGPLTRWAYLFGRWGGPRKSLRKARRAKLNEQKRSRKAEAKAFGS